ncbi:serine/threonine-protein kinase SBK1-like [Sinocyclocheilus rhinocerous]|uniref:Serine/threonine-protein kinase SBK1-like n=1 Tax=Sinocyclocheilus rhinocerous TaxID=307959 RepID=A0A673FYX5_9TELE|nr:PREDICTED: serine/threonine-protein kinase SBK1-like [Sinocyclocheilus rhinocerous]XP_016407271.1 PREDICTED: serine/threonine-protein kinase SBK1-like [Sinocyclocheilus rhinocerous]
MTTATRLLDELCHLTAQSLESLEPLDHFQVIKLLGEGSYGKVKLAVHKKRGTPMALKFFLRDDTSLLSFLREYNLSLAFCTHPSLTSALGIAFSTPTHYVFAQQPCLYGDLYDVIVPEVGLEESRAQGVASQISGALSHLHSLGFVHRDVKPENIFLCDRECRWVKLGDFGMVKAAGTRVPCVWYCSPYCTPEAEMARKNEENHLGHLGVDNNGNKQKGDSRKTQRMLVSVVPSIDSWALGILIYAMLMGSLPWSETISDNPAYKRYLQWTKWEGSASQESREGSDQPENFNQVAPQFAAFTPIATRLLRSLLHPQSRLRGRPDEVERYLGGAWLLDKDVSG